MSAAPSVIMEIALSFGFGFVLGIKSETDKWRAATVAHGKAEYYLDEHNERQWRWRETNGH